MSQTVLLYHFYVHAQQMISHATEVITFHAPDVPIGMCLVFQEKGSVSFAVDYEFAARMKPTWEFMPKSKGSYIFTGGKAVGYRNLFGMQWQDFIAEDSPYFRDNIVHLRAELTIKKQPPFS